MKFQVGDIVEPNEYARDYYVSLLPENNVLLKVVGVSREKVHVLVLEHKVPRRIGMRHTLTTKGLRLAIQDPLELIELLISGQINEEQYKARMKRG